MAEAIKSFVDRLFQHVPAEKQAEARSTYSALSDRVTRLEANEQAVQNTATQQRQWWEANKDAVAERDRLAQQIQQQQATPAGMTTNQIEEAINKVRSETLEMGLGLVTTISTVASAHMAEFGEPLNATELAQKAIAAGKTIDQYYADMVAPRRTERAQQEMQKQIDAARNEGINQGRKEVMDSTGRALPYPVGQAPITTLSGLRKPADGSGNQFSVEAAAATAMAEMQKQNQ